MSAAEEIDVPEGAFSFYWGTSPTGKPHLGYLIPLLKIRDLINSGCKCTILFADIHASLDSLKSTPEQVEARTTYYEIVIKAVLSSLGVDITQVNFVIGSSFQKSSQYVSDLYRLLSTTSLKASQNAGSEVVKQDKNPLLSSLIYPLMQGLDHEYLNVDVQLGGIDQRKIFMFAKDYGLSARVSSNDHRSTKSSEVTKRGYLMNSLLPGLTKSGKMSSSEPNSKIDFDECDESITSKILKAYAVDGVVENNAIVMISEHIIFRLVNKLDIVREEIYGGNISYFNIEDLKSDYINGKLGSLDLKVAVAKALIQIITPIRESISSIIYL